MINFDKIPLTVIENFKGGEGEFKANMFLADGIKIMRVTLEKGCSIGKHTHDTSSETMYILSGEGVCELENGNEIMRAGEGHYCPKGGTHSVKNEKDEPLVMFCIVQEL